MALEVLESTEVENIQKSKSWSKWLGPCASIACLVHCFLLSAILLLAPTLHAAWGLENLHRFEDVFWTVALLLGTYTIWNASVASWGIMLFWIIATPGLWGLVIHNHDLVHTSLLSMAVYQFAWVLAQHIRKKRSEELHCCDSHHKSHE